MRVDRARRWRWGGRELLALLFYQGEDAAADVICGQCRVRARLALLAARGGALALVATGAPWHPDEDVAALFDGRADFDPAEYALSGDEPLLGVRVPWSTGLPGVWQNLTLFRLQGEALTAVFSYGVDWAANGLGDDDERVASTVSMAPRAGGSHDLLVRTTEVRCRDAPGGADPFAQTCDAPRPVGVERWRFDGRAFRRVEGRPAPLPRVLHKRWGW